jgi:hypothetical protein
MLVCYLVCILTHFWLAFVPKGKMGHFKAFGGLSIFINNETPNYRYKKFSIIVVISGFWTDFDKHSIRNVRNRQNRD